MSEELIVRNPDRELIVRSPGIPPDRPYKEYRPYLRHDFFLSCAYCSMTEAEAQAIRFTIDHYEPKSSHPELENDYANLMYCCDECNMRKGDRCPPPSARADGLRFFRPDSDYWSDHFKRQGVRLEGSSKVGEFSIEAIDLNRGTLRKLRDLRTRLAQSERQIEQGVRGLTNFSIDQLPPAIRARALHFKNSFLEMREELAKAIDRALREAARSQLLEDETPTELKEATDQRRAALRGFEALYPENWRAERKRQPKK